MDTQKPGSHDEEICRKTPEAIKVLKVLYKKYLSLKELYLQQTWTHRVNLERRIVSFQNCPSFKQQGLYYSHLTVGTYLW